MQSFLENFLEENDANVSTLFTLIGVELTSYQLDYLRVVSPNHAVACLACIGSLTDAVTDSPN